MMSWGEEDEDGEADDDEDDDEDDEDVDINTLFHGALSVCGTGVPKLSFHMHGMYGTVAN